MLLIMLILMLLLMVMFNINVDIDVLVDDSQYQNDMKVIDRRNRYGFDTISCVFLFNVLLFIFFFLFPISKKFFAQSGMIKISDLTGMITCRSESNDH